MNRRSRLNLARAEAFSVLYCKSKIVRSEKRDQSSTPNSVARYQQAHIRHEPVNFPFSPCGIPTPEFDQECRPIAYPASARCCKQKPTRTQWQDIKDMENKGRSVITRRYSMSRTLCHDEVSSRRRYRTVAVNIYRYILSSFE
jgi:hypothetical protein